MTWRGVQMYTFQFYMLPLTFMVLFLFFFQIIISSVILLLFYWFTRKFLFYFLTVVQKSSKIMISLEVLKVEQVLIGLK